MSPLLFLLRSLLKNLMKGIFKKPVLLISYILLTAFFIFTIIMSFLMPSGMIRIASPGLFKGIMLLVSASLYYTSLKLGIEKGSAYFRMSDVNIVFTSPIVPNNVLFYGFMKQTGGTMLLLVIAAFQIPNLKNNFEMKPYGIPILLLAVLVYALSYPLISMLIYSWVSRQKSRKKMLKRLFDASALTVVVLFLLCLSQTRNVGSAIEKLFNRPIVWYFPVIGWTGSIASAAISGFTAQFWTGLAGMGLVIAAASFFLYHLNLDYYEDVLEGTEYIEAAARAKLQGNSMNFNAKVKSRVWQKLSGFGARTVFSKQILEMSKTSYFLFFDIASAAVIVTSIIFKFLMPDDKSEMSFFLMLCFSSYIMLLFQMQGRLNTELDKPFIYLIPASPLKKLFYVTLAEHLKNLIDGTLLFILSGIIFKADILLILVCIFSYVSFGAVFVYTGVLCRRIFGWVHSRAVLIYIKIFALLLILIPGIIAAAVAFIVTESELLMICALGGWSLVLAVICFALSPGILNSLETAG